MLPVAKSRLKLKMVEILGSLKGSIWQEFRDYRLVVIQQGWFLVRWAVKRTLHQHWALFTCWFLEYLLSFRCHGKLCGQAANLDAKMATGRKHLPAGASFVCWQRPRDFPGFDLFRVCGKIIGRIELVFRDVEASPRNFLIIPSPSQFNWKLWKYLLPQNLWVRTQAWSGRVYTNVRLLEHPHTALFSFTCFI